MRSRLPAVNRITNSQRKALVEFAEKEIEERTQDRIRKILKLMCYTLNREYGYGKHRLTTTCLGIEKISLEKDDDEVFWAHIDRVVIDELGMEFDREELE